MVGMMVTIHSVDHFDRHAEEASRPPLVHSRAHEPRGCGVAKCMRRHIRSEVRAPASSPKRCFDRLNGSAIPFNEVFANKAFFDPAPQMGEEARGNGHGRLTLVRLGAALLQTIE